MASGPSQQTVLNHTALGWSNRCITMQTHRSGFFAFISFSQVLFAPPLRVSGWGGEKSLRNYIQIHHFCEFQHKFTIKF